MTHEHTHGSTSSRFYPVTKKEHDMITQREGDAGLTTNVVYGETSDDGVGTHTTTSRYVPVTGSNKQRKGPFHDILHGWHHRGEDKKEGEMDKEAGGDGDDVPS